MIEVICRTPRDAGTALGILLACLVEHEHEISVSYKGPDNIVVALDERGVACLRNGLEKSVVAHGSRVD